MVRLLKNSDLETLSSRQRYIIDPNSSVYPKRSVCSSIDTIKMYIAD
jgi:hypothetical protein